MSYDSFEYDVAISFAGQDRAVAEELIRLLTDRNIKVLRDEYTSPELWGKDPLAHLVNIYARKARYCVLLISPYYPLKTWSQTERTSLQERAFRDANEYILPIRLEDTDMTETAEYRELRQRKVETLAGLLEQKLKQIKDRSGPPAQSHDLRSGNVPSTDAKP